jgi:hypothetical protein
MGGLARSGRWVLAVAALGEAMVLLWRYPTVVTMVSVRFEPQDCSGIWMGCWMGLRNASSSEWSGCGPEDFDGALGSGGSCEFLVAGEQGGVHGFGEGYVGCVVDGEVVP